MKIKLHLLFERAQQHNVRFNRQKLQLKVRQVKYLGNLISADGVQIDVDKVRAITEMPVPEDKKALLRFLGMIAYISKFIPNCSALTEPLRQHLINLNVLSVLRLYCDSLIRRTRI